MEIEFPFLWLTQLARASPKPWKYFDVEGIMLNAYDILKKPSIDVKMRDRGVNDYLNFKGVVAIDSGGFLFMKHKEIPISPEELVEAYEKWKPKFAVSLDHPITPSLSTNMIRKRQISTLKNIEIMNDIRSTKNPILIPVIHGYRESDLRWYIRRLDKLGDFPIYGIGSLVPLAKGIKGLKGGLDKAIDVVMIIKKLLPNKRIHVFGVGSSLTMHLMFLSGADSIDSSSWRSKAAYGAIQLPGIGDRYITGRTKKGYPNLSPEEQDIANKCGCPACKKYGLDGLKRSFSLRAIHNAWVYQNEVYKARYYITMGLDKYLEYVNNIMEKHKNYKKVLKYLNKKISSNINQSKLSDINDIQ